MIPVINHFLNTDLYKISMLQAYYHQYPNATGYWEFRNRNKDVKLGFLKDEVKKQILLLKNLKLTDEEGDYLKSLGYFQDDFINWLKNDFQVDLSQLKVWSDDDDQLQITVRGKLTEVNILEVWVLSIVNELYFAHDRQENNLFLGKLWLEGARRLEEKIKLLKEFPQLKFAEFGTRRRYSTGFQKYVIEELLDKCPNNIVGTSNVHFARILGTKPIGTCAHEWSMSHLGLVDDIVVAQKRALCVWQQEYGASLGIALSDTFTSKAFFRDFDSQLSKSYSGLRHDSFCPYKFGEMAINHYQKMGIDPRTKDIIFSDGLTVAKSVEIWKQFVGRIGVSFGIGTHFSNHVGRKPLNIVMKLLECNDVPCVKISDEPGKEMGCPEMIKKVKEAYRIR